MALGLGGIKEAMRVLFWLSDDAWAALAPHLPHNQPGKPRVDDRRVISGILHILKTGGRWRRAARMRTGEDHLQSVHALGSQGYLAAHFRQGRGLTLSERYDGDAAALYRHACAHDLEGIVSKRQDTPYRSGRFDGWRKIKCAEYRRE